MPGLNFFKITTTTTKGENTCTKECSIQLKTKKKGKKGKSKHGTVETKASEKAKLCDRWKGLNGWMVLLQISSRQPRGESNNDYGRKMRVKKDEKNVLTQAKVLY